MVYFNIELRFQSLEISNEKSKDWNGNSMTKHSIFSLIIILNFNLFLFFII